MVGRVTDVLETQNVEDAENNLNREITRIKMANESLISQRTIMNPNHSSHEGEHLQSRFMTPRDRNMTKEDIGDRTKMGISDSHTHNDITIRRAGYKDNSLSISNDVPLSMPLRQNMTTNPSRNELGYGLVKSSSTKEKINDQHGSLPSGNHFTLSEQQLVQAKFNSNDKPVKMSRELYEEYKHPNTIEEEKNNLDNSDNMMVDEIFQTNNPNNASSF